MQYEIYVLFFSRSEKLGHVDEDRAQHGGPSEGSAGVEQEKVGREKEAVRLWRAHQGAQRRGGKGQGVSQGEEEREQKTKVGRGRRGAARRYGSDYGLCGLWHISQE